MSIRPDWRTIQRPDLGARPFGHAAVGGPCRCGRDVEVGEPIVCLGLELVQDVDATRHVDLSGTEWLCLHCQGVPA